jgi:hypothetical protein
MRISTILSMRLQGHTLREIGAAQEKPVSAVAFHKQIRRAMAEMMIEPFEHIRTMELTRLDEMLSAVYPAALSGDVAAVDRVLAIGVRRARMLGLDAAPVVSLRFGAAEDRDNPPTARVEVVGGTDPEHVRRLEERLRLLEGGEPPRSIRLN